MSDEELMTSVVRGDLHALSALFERYKEPLFGFLCRLLRDRALAEDLLLDVFLRVHDRRRTYKTGMRFSTWLYTIAHHLAVDRLKHASHRETPASFETQLVDDQSQQALERAELAQRVREAVCALPEDLRMVIILREYQELSYREIARITGASEDAVRVRAHRARQALKKALEPMLDEDLVTFHSP